MEVIIGCGMLAGIWIAHRDAKRRGQDPEMYTDLALYGIICSIIGARLYYVIFSWDYYKDNLLEILNLRGGGLAIYGGVLAAALTLFVFTRVRKVSIFFTGGYRRSRSDHRADDRSVGKLL